MYKSTNGGTTLGADHERRSGRRVTRAQNATRFSIGRVASAARQQNATLYMGTDWIDAQGYHYARVFKSTNGGASWTILPGGAPRQP